MSTAIMLMTGTRQGEGKPIELAGSYAQENGAKQTLYVAINIMDADKFVVELYAKTADGKKRPILETIYTRKK